MYTWLILSTLFSIVVSAVCSLMEAALYSSGVAYIKSLSDKNPKKGARLYYMKSNIAKPISAILILNTIANSAGAAIAGAKAGEIWGNQGILIFSAFFTLMILFFSEIFPKQVGVRHSRTVMYITTDLLLFLVKLLTPLILVIERISNIVIGKSEDNQVSEDEIVALAGVGQEEGVIDDHEEAVIRNVISLDTKSVSDVLTPRVVVYRLDEKTKLSDVQKEISKWQHSRVPLYSSDNPEYVKSYVHQRDVYEAIVQNAIEGMDLTSIARPIKVVPDVMGLDKLMVSLMKEGDHIAAVANEHGSFMGIVTLEDIIEELLGEEIVDEYDKVVDMREARGYSNEVSEDKNSESE